MERIIAALDAGSIDIAWRHLVASVGKEGGNLTAAVRACEDLGADVCGAHIVEIVRPRLAPSILHSEVHVGRDAPSVAYAEGHAHLHKLVLHPLGVGRRALAFGGKGLKVVPGSLARDGVEELCLGVELEEAYAAEDIGRGPLLGAMVEAVGEEVELRTQEALAHVGTEAEVATPFHIGVAAFYMAVAAAESKRPACVEIDAGYNASREVYGTEHALVVQVAQIVHAATHKAHLAT